MEVQTSVLWTLHMNISYLCTDAILRRNLKIGKRPGESVHSHSFLLNDGFHYQVIYCLFISHNRSLVYFIIPWKPSRSQTDLQTVYCVCQPNFCQVSVLVGEYLFLRATKVAALVPILELFWGGLLFSILQVYTVIFSSETSSLYVVIVANVWRPGCIT